MNTQPLYHHIASIFNALQNCRKSSNEFAATHESNLIQLVSDFMPHGSGIDCGVKFLEEESSSEKLVFSFGFHHMDENGMYDGWTEHKLIVKSCLLFDLNLKITGRDRNQIKEYLHEIFSHALNDEIAYDENGFYSVEMRKRQAEFRRKVASGEIV